LHDTLLVIHDDSRSTADGGRKPWQKEIVQQEFTESSLDPGVTNLAVHCGEGSRVSAILAEPAEYITRPGTNTRLMLAVHRSSLAGSPTLSGMAS